MLEVIERLAFERHANASDGGVAGSSGGGGSGGVGPGGGGSGGGGSATHGVDIDIVTQLSVDRLERLLVRAGSP